MQGRTQSRTGQTVEAERYHSPEISVCESCPGKAVFLESGNTDGWIASDLTIEPER
ncbi:MAG: hypothetical protein ACI8XM_001179 [Haloarculaceae archaeon]|jgi:hypothetical protein